MVPSVFDRSSSSRPHGFLEIYMKLGITDLIVSLQFVFTFKYRHGFYAMEVKRK